MSVQCDTGSDYLRLTFGAPLTIGTGDLSLGIWCRIDSIADFGNIAELGDAPDPGTKFGIWQYTSGYGGITAHYSTGNGIPGGYSPSADTEYWAVASRAGTTVRCRVFNEAGTKLLDITNTDSTNYTTLDTILLGNNGAGNPSILGRVSNFKIHTGVAWSDSEAWDEAQYFHVRTAGGTDRYAFGLETTGTGTYQLLDLENGTALLTNTGAVDNASRPSVLEAPYGAATTEQEGSRFRNDDGSESTATWKATQDTDLSEAAGALRLRMLLNVSGDLASKRIGLGYTVNGGQIREVH